MAENVILFHISTEQKLPDIIERDGLIPTPENEVFVFAKWAAMVPFLENALNDEDDIIYVILRITIPLDEFDAVNSMYKDVTMEDAPFDSWYFEKTIPISYIEIATYDNDTFDYTVDGQPWSFKPLAKHDVEKRQLLPDLPIPGVTDEFDMSEDFMDANKSIFERINDCE